MERENEKFFSDFFCSRTSKLKHVLVPSLQHLTMVKIAIELWNQIDLRESIVNFGFSCNYRGHHRKWREIEEKALNKVAQLPLPEVLKKDFLRVISPIGLQFKKWWKFHKGEKGQSKLPNRLWWTSRGTIDRVKTADCLVKNEDMDVDTRYKLACMYCMEDVIPEAWERLDEERKQYYYTIDETDRHRKHKFKFLLTFWAYQLKGEASKLDDLHSANCLMLENSVWMGNKMAAEFFLGKVTDGEKNGRFEFFTSAAAILMSKMPFSGSNSVTGYYDEVFLLLLSSMSKGQRERAFQNYPYELLKCLLEWPNRPLFIELAERTLHSIDDNRHHRKLMSLFIKDIVNGWSDCTSRQLFHHFWNLCPLSYKKRAIERIDYCTVMKLYEGNDVEIIRTLFQHACAEEKEGLILCQRERDTTVRSFYRNLLHEPSVETVVNFRTEFLERNDK